MPLSKAENRSEIKAKRVWEIGIIIDRAYGMAVNDPNLNSEGRSEIITNALIAYLLREGILE